MAFKIRHIDSPIVETTRSRMWKTLNYWGKKPPNIVAKYIEHYCPKGGIVLDPL